MEKAKKKVIQDGYAFVKGESRSKAERSKSPAKKRAKLSSEERAREIDSLHKTLKVLKNRIMFKNQQLQKEKSMNNYKKCDEISEKILEIQREKKSVDRQLTVLVKKEGKAQWYLSGKSRKSSSKPKNVYDNQSKLPDLFRQDSMSSASASTDDTVIISDPEDLGFKIHATKEGGPQELDENPPQSPVLIEESRATVNDCAQEFVQGATQTEEMQNFC